MKKPIYVVLGLPQSGIELMIQMLSAGGIPFCVESAVNGHIFDLPKETGWLKKCHGHMIWVLEPLVFVLPRTFEYRFIVMHRNPMEQAKAFRERMQSMGIETEYPDYEENLEESFQVRTAQIVNKYQMYPGRLKKIAFEQLIVNPTAIATELQAFLKRPLDIAAMTAIAQEHHPDGSHNLSILNAKAELAA